MIGTALIQTAVENGTDVYAVVRKDTKRLDRMVESPLVHPIYGDLASLKNLEGLPSECDAFYHFAWAGTNKEERDDALIQEANIRYTLDVVEVAKRCGSRKFIGAGSQAEYGPTDGFIDDGTRFAPVTAYGTAKFSAGRLSRKLCDKNGIIHIWGRIFSVYGPHDNAGTMLNYAIRQFSHGEEAKFSAGTQMWNYLYESDAGMIFYLLGEKIEQSTAFRVADKKSQPLREYIRVVSRIMDSERLYSFSEEDSTNKVYGIDTCDQRLFDSIGFEPQIDFEDGIRRMIANTV